MKTLPPNLRRLFALYVRVSTEDQADKYSIPSQLAVLRKKLVELDGETRDDLIFEDHQTGTDTDRPGLQAMLAAAKERRIQGILMVTADRFSRDPVTGGLMMRDFKRYVVVEFAYQKFDDSPMGEFLFGLMLSIAKLERDQFMQRSLNGRILKLQTKREDGGTGYLTSGSVPFGYRYKGKREGSRGEMIVHEAEAAVVGLVFEWYSAGHTLYGIRKMLNDAGIKTTNGNLWSRTTVYQMVRNRTYVGRAAIGKGTAHEIEVKVPAIVSQDLFMAAALKLKANRVARAGRPTRTYTLSGLVFCRHCDRRYKVMPRGSRSKNDQHYCCGNVDYKTMARRCQAAGVGRKKLEGAVWDTIWGALTDPQRLYRLMEAYHSARNQPSKSIPGMEAALKKLRRREERAIEILKDPDTMVPYKQAKANLEAVRFEVGALEMKLRQHQSVLAMPSKTAIAALARDFLSGEPQTPEERRTLLQAVVSRIVYGDREYTVECILQIPAATPAGGNCYSPVSAYNNKFLAIPFTLKGRVA